MDIRSISHCTGAGFRCRTVGGNATLIAGLVVLFLETLKKR